jgi:diguanylate cyclase (GGDEF)-like protein/PAS domain S-box-containing protein
MSEFIVHACAAAAGLLGVGLSAQQRRRAARRERPEQRRLRQLGDAGFEGLLLHRDGVVVEANAAAEALLGRSRAMIVGCDMAAFVSDAFAPRLADALRETPRGPVDVEIDRPGDAPLPVELQFRPVAWDEGEAVAVALRDLTERRLAEQRLDFLAHHDGLTGLPNRLLFNDRLSQAIELSARSGHGLAVICVDLDRFKEVRDLLGHGGGDQVLAQVATRLTATLRAIDTVARLDGDQFGIIQPLVERPEQAVMLARRLVACLAEPLRTRCGHEAALGASCGIALFPSDATSANSLLRNAGTALYYAKHDGRGAWRFFEHGMDQMLQQRLALAQDLRGAIERGELELHYQPYFASGSGRLLGFEALLRWLHPVHGPLLPADFVPLADASGLIEQLGGWVLHTACTAAADDLGPLRIAVNLSPAQFPAGTLPRLVAETLQRTGLPADRLELEVTEKLLIEQPDRSLAALTQLHDMGVRLCLDDFGTGFSSLGCLQRFPFDKVKIDRSYIESLGTDDAAGAVVRAVVGLAHGLHMVVTAEGVETEAQASLLRGLQCHEMQGYLFAQPAPLAVAMQLLAEAEPAHAIES